MMINDDKPMSLPMLILASDTRTKSERFIHSVQSFLFSAIAGTGDTAEVVMTDRHNRPQHIGATPGQPIAAYLNFRNPIIILTSNAGASSMAGVIVYKDTQGLEHYLGGFSVSALAAGLSVAINIPIGLIIEAPLTDRDRTMYGSVFVRVLTAIFAGSTVDINVYLNTGVLYGFTDER